MKNCEPLVSGRDTAIRCAVGHRQQAGSGELQIGVELVVELGSVGIVLASLDHETLDDPVEGQVVVEAVVDQRHDPIDRVRRQVLEELDRDSAVDVVDLVVDDQADARVLVGDGGGQVGGRSARGQVGVAHRHVVAHRVIRLAVEREVQRRTGVHRLVADRRKCDREQLPGLERFDEQPAVERQSGSGGFPRSADFRGVFSRSFVEHGRTAGGNDLPFSVFRDRGEKARLLPSWASEPTRRNPLQNRQSLVHLPQAHHAERRTLIIHGTGNVFQQFSPCPPRSGRAKAELIPDMHRNTAPQRGCKTGSCRNNVMSPRPRGVRQDFMELASF